MLGKLLKYDLKWVYKIVVVFYILSLFFSVVGRGLSYIENSVIFSIVTTITFSVAISMMVSSVINSFMRLWVRFIKNIYKDEAYLTHTLPISKKTIYASKVISAIVCIFTTSIVIAVCLFICYYSKENIELLKLGVQTIASNYNITVINLLLLITFVLFLELLFIVLVGYVGIIIGHKFNKNKILKSIIVGFALYIITQIITLVFVYIFGLFNPSIMNLINTTDVIDVNAMKTVMYVAILIYFLYILFYYFLGRKHLESGVNID